MSARSGPSAAANSFAQLARIVLAVAVDLDHVLVAVLVGVLEAGLDGAADAHVERHAQHLRAGPLGAIGRRVGGAVVDHHDVDLRRVAVQRRDDAGDGGALVVGGHDGQARGAVCGERIGEHGGIGACRSPCETSATAWGCARPAAMGRRAGHVARAAARLAWPTRCPAPVQRGCRSWSSRTTAAPRSPQRCPRCATQLRPGDELVVVDNDSSDDTLARRGRDRARRRRRQHAGATPASRPARTPARAPHRATCSSSSTRTRRRRPGSPTRSARRCTTAAAGRRGWGS